MSSVILKSPKSFWKRDWKLNFKQIGQFAVKGVAGVISFDWPDVVNSVTELVSGSGDKSKPEKQATILIRMALKISIEQILLSLNNLRSKKEETTKKIFEECIYQSFIHIDESIEQKKLFLDNNFLDAPDKWTYLLEFKILISDIIATVLDKYGISAYNISTENTEEVFAVAVINIWEEMGQQFIELKNCLLSENPLSNIGKRFSSWKNYKVKIRNEWNNKPISYDDNFAISKIYIPLRALTQKNDKKAIVDLENNIKNWIDTSWRREARLVIINGGPGAGKSTIIKSLATYFSLYINLKPIVVPINSLKLDDKNLENSINQYLTAYHAFPDEELKTCAERGERLIFFFDGLDELKLQKNIGFKAVRQFIDSLNEFLQIQNANSERIKIVLTGRDFAIQEQEDILIREGKIFTLLPYVIQDRDLSEETNINNRINDAENLLKIDQRDTWWFKYGKATSRGPKEGEVYKKLPDYLNSDKFKEITSQPLQNYLLAKCIEESNYLPFDSLLNLELTKRESPEIVLCRIYNWILKKIFLRSWGDINPQIDGINIGFEDFKSVLQEIALVAWHTSQGKEAYYSDIEKYCKKAELYYEFKALNDENNYEDNFIRFFTAFYFRKADKKFADKGDWAIEFTHRSFSEYLLACRLMKEIDSIGITLKRKKEKMTERMQFDDEQKIRNVLDQWADLTGPNPINKSILDFLEGEIGIKFKTESEKVSEWQEMLSYLFSYVLLNGISFNKIERSELSFQEKKIHCKNAEEALFVSLYCCSINTKKVSKLQLIYEREGNDYILPSSNINLFGTWYRTIQPQGGRRQLVNYAMAYLDFTGFNLSYLDLSDSKMSGSILKKANLKGSNFNQARFLDCNLSEADMSFSKIDHGSFFRTTLIKTNMESSILTGSKFRNSNLSASILKNSNLKFSEIISCKVEDTVVDNADFSDADIRDTLFSEVQKSKQKRNH